MIRTFAHRIVEAIVRYTSVPVIGGLIDYSYPSQALADYCIQKKPSVRVTYELEEIGEPSLRNILSGFIRGLKKNRMKVNGLKG